MTKVLQFDVGVSLSLTGLGSRLGIPVQNGLKLAPVFVAGEKLRLLILDDATDPTKGAVNAIALKANAALKAALAGPRSQVRQQAC